MFQKLTNTKDQYGNFSRYANKINPNFFISNSPIEKEKEKEKEYYVPKHPKLFNKVKV